jgi:hypothetical protein
MTREDRIKCPACGKIVARLEVHFRQSHPDLDPDTYGLVLGIPETPAEPVGSPEFSRSADLPADASESETEPDLVPPAFDMQAIMSPIVEAMKRQQQVINELQGQLLQQQKDAAEFQQSVVGHLNGLPNLVDRSLTQRLDQLAGQYQSQQEGMPDMGPDMPGAAAPSPRPNPSAAMASDPKAQMLMQLLPVIAQKLLAPEPAQGGTDFDKMVKLLEGVDKIAEMRQAPYRNGFDDALKLLTTANRMGVPTEKIQSMSELKGSGTPPAA